MLVHATSAGFEQWYGLRLIAATAALGWSVPRLKGIDWRASWRGALAGAGVFLIWVAAASVLTKPGKMPAQLATKSPLGRDAWIALRALTAIVTVPITEELAYRGYLMRRLIAVDFESVRFQDVALIALGLSALAFGVLHGALWPAGIIAGLVYGGIAIRTGRLGEAIIAHGASNALLAAYVISAAQWQLW
jgi:CAAX prenyl protease-like protein